MTNYLPAHERTLVHKSQMLTIRANHQNKTHFLLCDPEEPVELSHKKMGVVYGVGFDDVRFYLGTTELAPDVSWKAQQVRSGDILVLKLRGADGKFEPFPVAEPKED